ncbi:AgrD family cyclic lactone autoinducer peptide [Meiothermus ruber]|nr:cyclic lactone autoinducer peptide [Meiothermus ruber]
MLTGTARKNMCCTWVWHQPSRPDAQSYGLRTGLSGGLR